MKKVLFILSLFISNFIQSQIVNIPDVNFKNALLNHDPIIDTNSDDEIQVTEAESYSQYLNVANKNIFDLTGIEFFLNINELHCFNNQLSTLNLSNNTNLIFLNCFSNQLITIDISNNINLYGIDCSSNQLTNLNISNDTNLHSLQCFDNQLSTLVVDTNSNLTILNCSSNQLSEIDVSNNSNLFAFKCNNNQLTNINVTDNISLTNLQFSNNQISNLDVSNNINLNKIYCSNNLLNTLDISNNNNIMYLQCNGNLSLSYINLKNGNNINIPNVLSDFENLPALQSVCVDDINNTSFTNYILNEVGHSVSFSENCTLAVLENTFLNFSVYPIPTENILNIKSKTEIVKVEFYNKLGQKIKETTENGIDISNLTQGLYFVKVEDINGNFGVKKIVKK